MLSVCHCCLVRRKSKQAMRDYKKVQIQLENLETSVRDRCKKEFTGTNPLRLIFKNNTGTVTIPNNPHFIPFLLLQTWWRRWWTCRVIWWAQGFPSWITGHTQSAFSSPATRSHHWGEIWMFLRVGGKLWSKGWFSCPICSTVSSFSPRWANGVWFRDIDFESFNLT